MTYKKVILYAIASTFGLAALAYALPARSEVLTPKEIERQVISEGHGMLSGGFVCTDMAKRAKEIAIQNGYKAYYRQDVRKWDEVGPLHIWLVIVDDQGIKHEILKNGSKETSGLDYAKQFVGWNR